MKIKIKVSIENEDSEYYKIFNIESSNNIPEIMEILEKQIEINSK